MNETNETKLTGFLGELVDARDSIHKQRMAILDYVSELIENSNESTNNLLIAKRITSILSAEK